MNKKLFSFFALLAVSMFASSAVFAFGSQRGGDGSRYDQLIETAIFQNNASATLQCGTVVILDTSATAGSTLGSYITTTTIADDSRVVGIIASEGNHTYANGTATVVVTRGPVRAWSAGTTDPFAAGELVGSTTRAGQVGRCKPAVWTGVGGNNPPQLTGFGSCVGVALEDGTTDDYTWEWIWVDPR